MRGVSSGFGGLHLDLDAFPRAEKHVGDQFGSGGRTGPNHFSVSSGSFLSKNFGVKIFENFIKSEFSESLERISDQSRSESESKSSDSIFGSDFLNTSDHRFVKIGVNLSSTFNEIDRGDSGMGKSTSHSSSNHTF